MNDNNVSDIANGKFRVSIPQGITPPLKDMERDSCAHPTSYRRPIVLLSAVMALIS